METAETARDVPVDGGTRPGGPPEAAPGHREPGREGPGRDELAGSVAAGSLAELTEPVAGQLRVAAALQVVASVAAVAPLALIGVIGTRLVEGRTVGAGIVAAVIAALAVRALAEAAALAVSHSADARLQHHLRWRIVTALSRAPLRWFSATPSGTVRRAVTDDVDELHFLVAHARIEQVAGVVTPLAGLAWCAVLDWRLALVAAIPLVAYGAASAVAMRGAAGKMERIAETLGTMSAAIADFVHGIAVVKIFGTQKTAHERFVEASREYRATYGAWARSLTMGSAVAGVMLSAPVILLMMMAFGLWFIGAGWVGPVEVITAALIAMVIPSTVVSLGFSAQYRRQAEAAAQRIADILRVEALPEAREPARIADGSIEIDRVTYRYGDGAAVLRDVTLSVPDGTKVALVGPSGAGKSTLATLVARFDDPSSGAIRIGGADVRDIPPAQLNDTVAFVLQDTELVSMSIADNIRLGRPGATIDEIREAARRAQVHDDIMALPDGYATPVDSDASLSGGQRQRIAIARALLKNAPVVILDEATAFADPNSEAQIQRALSALAADSTVLVIAHRLHTIAHCDRIAVLDRGKVAECGTHDELLELGGLYADLWGRLNADERGGKE